MTPAILDQHSRRLRRSHDITHAQHTILCVLLWTCRRRGSTSCRVSLDRLAALSGAARSTVALAIERFIELGLIDRVKTWITVGWQRLQGVNVYVFRSESDWRPANRGPVRKKRASRLVNAPIAPVIRFAETLESIAKRRMKQLRLG